jgi:hypothetical protein
MVLYRFLADAAVVAHVAYVAFVVLGLVAILIGVARRWRWVRNFWFRSIHFLMILVVVVQAIFGVICPLTTLENYLREEAGQTVYCGSFIGYWAHELIFYSGPPWVFTLCYCLFGAGVLATLVLAPPQRPRPRGKRPRDAMKS